MLRKIRTAAAVLAITLVTLLFLDFTGTMTRWFGFMAKVQFLPAVLAFNTAVVVGLLLVTLLFGRIYCSVICPLGILQDTVSWISAKRKGKKARFSYSPEKKNLRYGVLLVFVLLVVAGFTQIALFIAPYSAFGRIAESLLAPIWAFGNNVLAGIAEHFNSYAFYETSVWAKSLIVPVTAIVTLATVGVLAWKNGRTWCNTICPVGTVLGFVSQYAIFRPVIDEKACKNCGLCARKCKASAIDFKNGKVDTSRCVACFDCIDACNAKAISFKNRLTLQKQGKTVNNAQQAVKDETVDTSRRSFLIGTGLLAAGLAKAQKDKKVDGGLATILDKKVPVRETPILPAGSFSAKHFAQHCTGCQLCVANCPNGVLRPSSDLGTLMQPHMEYDRGYCRPECTKCSEVCPAGAIKPITPAEKSSIQIGHAVWVKKNCIVLTDNVECGNCARHCPNGAIQMVPSDPANPESHKIPAINTERCIGCGACENLCPSRPFSAIYVEGHEMHKEI